MSKALLQLGLFVASGYRKKQDDEAAAAKVLAEAAAKAQEKQDTIDVEAAKQSFIGQKEIAVAAAAADRKALDQQRALGVRTYMWGDGSGNIEYTTSFGPETTKSPGPEWTQLATALGYNPGQDGNKFNLNSEYTPDPNIPLYNFRGTPRTTTEIKNTLLQENASLPPLMQLDLSGPGVSSKITGPAIGHTNRKNGLTIYSPEDVSVIRGYRTKQEYRTVGKDNKIVRGPLTMVAPIARETGNKIQTVSYTVNAAGERIGGEETVSEFTGIRTGSDTIKSELITAVLPTKAGGTRTVTNVTDDELLVELNKLGLNKDDVVHYTYGIEKDKYTGEVIDRALKNSYTPPDVEVMETVVDLQFPNGDTLTDQNPADISVFARERGISPSAITVVEKDVTTVNGEITKTEHKNITRGETRVAVGYITDANGNRVEVTGPTQAALENTFKGVAGFESAGMGKMDSSGFVSLDNAVESREVELISGPDFTNVPIEDATQTQIESATSSRKGTISPTTGEVNVTGSETTLLGEARIAASMNVPMKIKGTDVYLGAPADLDKGVQLARMNRNLNPDNLKQLVDEGQADEYINAFGPLVVSHLNLLDTQSREQTGQSLFRNKSLAAHVKSVYPRIFAVPGMQKYLTEIETTRIQNTISTVSDRLASLGAASDVPVVAVTSTNPTTIDEDNARENPVESGSSTTVVGGNIPAKYSSFVTKTLNPILIAVNDGVQNKTKLDIMDLMSKKYDQNGQPVMVDGVVAFERSQPILDAWIKMSSEKLPGAGNKTMFTTFVDAANGAAVKSADFEYMAGVFIGSGESLSDLVTAVTPLIGGVVGNPMNGTSFIPPDLKQAAMRNGIGEFSTRITEQNYQSLSTKQNSAYRVINLSNMMINTLFDYNANGGQGGYRGSVAVGDIELTVDGLFYLGSEGLSRVKTALNIGDAETLANEIKGNLNDYANSIYERYRADDPTAKPPNFDLPEEKAARREIERIIDDIAAEAADIKDDEVKRLYASRQLYIVSLAYELSATMQGGTGGRTISDQDVAIILKALRQKFTATPQSQVAVLEEIKRISQDIATDMDYQMSQNPQESAGYYFVKAMSAVNNDPRGYHRPINAATVASRIRGSGPEGVQVDDKVILDSLNMRRGPGDKYESIDDIPPELLETTRKRLQGN
jgi:hypothetical protein